MTHNLISYSPYRNALRQAKRNETADNNALNSKNEIIKIHISPLVLISSMMFFIFVLGGLYLWNFNKVATKGYILKRLELSRQELQEQNDIRNLNTSKAKSMSQIIASGAIDHMRKPSSVNYVLSDTVLAKAD